jgi:ABC-type polysaccharide/polyol phosphate transport system ATPase subunit
LQFAVEFENATKHLFRRFEHGRKLGFLSLLRRSLITDAPPSDEQYPVLNELNLRIPVGSRFVLLCSDRDTQTCLTRLLGGLTALSSGRLIANGETQIVSTKARMQRPLLSLRRHLFSLNTFIGLSHTEANEKTAQVIKLFNAEALEKEKLVDIAPELVAKMNYFTTLLSPAKIVIFDEVFLSDLPEVHESALRDKTAIYVACRAKFPRTLFDQGAVLHEGSVVEQGNSSDIVAKFEQLADAEALQVRASHDSAADDDDPSFDDEDDDKQPPPAPPERKLPRTVALGDLKIYGSDQQLTRQLKTGDSCSFSVSYVVKDPAVPLPEIFVALSIRSGARHLIAAWSELIDQSFSNLPAEGQFTLCIPKMPLLPGSYSINCSVRTKGELFDKVVWNECFEVVEGDFYGTGPKEVVPVGVFCMEFAWKLETPYET